MRSAIHPLVVPATLPTKRHTRIVFAQTIIRERTREVRLAKRLHHVAEIIVVIHLHIVEPIEALRRRAWREQLRVHNVIHIGGNRANDKLVAFALKRSDVVLVGADHAVARFTQIGKHIGKRLGSVAQSILVRNARRHEIVAAREVKVAISTGSRRTRNHINKHFFGRLQLLAGLNRFALSKVNQGAIAQQVIGYVVQSARKTVFGAHFVNFRIQRHRKHALHLRAHLLHSQQANHRNRHDCRKTNRARGECNYQKAALRIRFPFPHKAPPCLKKIINQTPPPFRNPAFHSFFHLL